MLVLVERARREGAGQVTLALDPADGHPVSVSVDWAQNAIDDEECYEITEYVAIPSN